MTDSAVQSTAPPPPIPIARPPLAPPAAASVPPSVEIPPVLFTSQSKKESCCLCLVPTSTLTPSREQQQPPQLGSGLSDASLLRVCLECRHILLKRSSTAHSSYAPLLQVSESLQRHHHRCVHSTPFLAFLRSYTLLQDQVAATPGSSPSSTSVYPPSPSQSIMMDRATAASLFAIQQTLSAHHNNNNCTPTVGLYPHEVSLLTTEWHRTEAAYLHLRTMFP